MPMQAPPHGGLHGKQAGRSSSPHPAAAYVGRHQAAGPEILVQPTGLTVPKVHHVAVIMCVSGQLGDAMASAKTLKSESI